MALLSDMILLVVLKYGSSNSESTGWTHTVNDPEDADWDLLERITNELMQLENFNYKWEKAERPSTLATMAMFLTDQIGIDHNNVVDFSNAVISVDFQEDMIHYDIKYMNDTGERKWNVLQSLSQ